MADKFIPDLRLLRQLLHCDSNGRLVWRLRPQEMFNTMKACRTWNSRYAGQEAFACVNAGGYKVSSIFDQKFYGHRVVFAMTHGRWPELEIDHIDGNRQNNHPTNLREATSTDNKRNSAMKGNNTSGREGVYQHQNGSWRATIVGQHLGYFSSFARACAARDAAEKTHGFHANHGRSA